VLLLDVDDASATSLKSSSATPADATLFQDPMVVAARVAMWQYAGCLFNRLIEVSLAASPRNSVTAFITSVTRCRIFDTQRKRRWNLMIAGVEFAFIKR
jgi:hypothetical protein